VIEVENGEADLPSWRKFAQNVEQTDRIGTAGDRYTNTLAMLEHAMAFDESRDAV
jgi:hypothetical protein